MHDRTMMVTGATAGIGEVTARTLAEQGATVIVVGRNPERCRTTVNRITQRTGNPSVEFMVADLSSQAEIRQLADAFKRRHERLHALVNNAGAAFARRRESVDGIEVTFALNHLGYFLLTNLLLDTLKASAPSRIINVSSNAHKRTTINFDDLEGRQKYSRWLAYGQSKLANILFTYELARRLEGTGVTVNALHPGFVATNFGMDNGRWWRWLRYVINFVALSPEEGAQTSIYLATSPEVEGVSGKYFVKKEAVSSSEASYDEATARRLWQVSAEMTELPLDDSPYCSPV
jgi:NAD(P)-dependent dehydrogenase (short-subunit alcohol dehydrogenase family)